MSGPGDDRVTGAWGHARLRAPHGDREQAVEVLKAAFVEGRLAKDELDERTGQVLSARTYAELAAVTADLPAETTEAGIAAAPGPRDATVRTGAHIIVAATVSAAGLWAGALLSGAADEMAMLLIAVAWIWLGLMIFTGSAMLQARLQAGRPATCTGRR